MAMKRMLLALAIVLGVVGVTFLLARRGGPRPPWPRPLTDLQVAEAWLSCIDCQGPFLRRLHDMPASNRDTVIKLLHGALVRGPDTARAGRLTQDLVRVWLADSTSRVGRGEKPDTGFSSFLKRYQDGFETKWRVRAAIALGVIPAPAAMAALNNASQLPQVDHRDSLVHRVIAQARDSGLIALGHYKP